MFCIVNGVFNSILFFYYYYDYFISFFLLCVKLWTNKKKNNKKADKNKALNEHWTLNTFVSIRCYCDYLFSVEGFDHSNEMLIVCLWSRLPASQHWCILLIVVVDHWKIWNGFWEKRKNYINVFNLFCI